MLNMVKKLAKAIKGATRPKSSKVQVTIPRHAVTLATAPPAREELTARMVQALRSEVDTKLKAFLNACANYPADYDIDYWHELEGANLIDAAAALGFSEVAGFSTRSLAALCAAMEYQGLSEESIGHSDEFIEMVARAVDTIVNDEYAFLPEVYDDEHLGDEICEMLMARVSWKSHYNWVLEFVDKESLGNVWRNDEGGIYTDRGYFQFGKIKF